MPTATSPPPPTWREWTGLLLLALPLFMMATDFTVMFMAMPAVTADLAPSTTQTLWITHIGEFVAAGLVITMGWLTGRIGPRPLLLAAMGLYALVSAMAAFSPNPETLLAARVLIGAAGGAASPAAIAMLRSMFPNGKHFGIAFATLMGAFSAGGALGPPMGGLLLEHFWWGSVFLVNVPVAAIVLIAGLWLFPRNHETNQDRIDVISVALSMAAIIAVVFGLQEIADQGVTVPYVVTVLVGIGLAVVFIRRQRTIVNPLLDLTLFSIRALRTTATVFILSSMAFVSVYFILVQYLQVVAAVPVTQLGLMLTAPGAAAVLGTALTPPLARRFAPSHFMAGGATVSVIGTLAIITAILVAPHPVWLFIVGTALVTFGITPLMTLGAQLIVTSAPAKRAGQAVAIQDIGSGLGGALGMAFIGSLAMAVFSRMLATDAPTAVTETEVEAAGQSLGGAVSVAEGIGGPVGEALLATAQDAWSMGTLAAYVTAAVLGVATILVILRGLRGIALPADLDASPSQTPQDDPAPALSSPTNHQG